MTVFLLVISLIYNYNFSEGGFLYRYEFLHGHVFILSQNNSLHVRLVLDVKCLAIIGCLFSLVCLSSSLLVKVGYLFQSQTWTVAPYMLVDYLSFCCFCWNFALDNMHPYHWILLFIGWCKLYCLMVLINIWYRHQNTR